MSNSQARTNDSFFSLSALRRIHDTIRDARRNMWRLAWSPFRAVYMRSTHLRRTAAWARLHRRGLTAAFVLIAHVLGVLSSLNVLVENRTPQGSIAWIVSLNTFPYIAVPVYWMIGETDYDEYAIAFRDRRARGGEILEQLNEDLAAAGLSHDAENDSQRLLQRLVNLPLTRGNSAELLVDGVETFDAMFESIERARSYVLVEFYILRDDNLGNRLKDVLIRKSREGVRVMVLYDEYGSGNLSRGYVEEMLEAGVEVHGFNPPLEDVSPTRLNFRNHRKLVIVDGREALVGGHNVGDEYLSGDGKAAPYRDTHVLVRGPLVQCCQIVFAEDWHAVCDKLLDDLNWDPQPAEAALASTPEMKHDLVGLCLPSGPADDFETASMFFLQAIHGAKDRVWIASPYFVPDQQMVTALQLAALRGVDVRVLIPQESDSTLVWLSSYSYLPQMEAAGVKMYRYQSRFMHQKVILVDDSMAGIGTANFDNRSFRLNFEIMMLLFDQRFAQQVAEMLETDLSNSDPAPASELEDASYAFRLLVHGARLLAPIQ